MEHSVPKNKPEPVRTVDARVRRSRQALRIAFLELLQSTALEYVTIRDIAASAGVGYTTFFRHYPSKEALLDDLAAEEIGRLCDLTVPVYDAVDSRAACLALTRFVDQHRPIWAALLTGGASGVVREELLRRGREASAGRGSSWLPAELGLTLAVSAMLELMTWWLRQPEPESAERIAEILDRIAISPVEARAAAANPSDGTPT